MTPRGPVATWFRRILGGLLMLLSIGVLIARGSVLFANNPVYPITMICGVVVGVLLIARAPHPRRRFSGAAGTIGAVLLLGWIYYCIPAPASVVALAALDAPVASDGVTVSDSRTQVELIPTEANGVGLVFMPGALVDPRAYSAMLRPVAAAGTLVVIVKAPYDLALLAAFAPNGILSAHPEVQVWTTAGHSLGGVAAASFADRNPDRVAGLIFWASFPAGDMSTWPGSVLSVSGERDGLSTPAKIEASKPQLPLDTEYVVVPGAVHSFFGDYGEQSGDGTATAPRLLAQAEIVTATNKFLASLIP